MPQYIVYILTNKPYGTLYIGFTNDIARRMREHKSGATKGFTYKYNLTKLVYFEIHKTNSDAFIRERQIKKWKRAWKIELIENQNPEWKDLAEDWD